MAGGGRSCTQNALPPQGTHPACSPCSGTRSGTTPPGHSLRMLSVLRHLLRTIPPGHSPCLLPLLRHPLRNHQGHQPLLIASGCSLLLLRDSKALEHGAGCSLRGGMRGGGGDWGYNEGGYEILYRTGRGENK